MQLLGAVLRNFYDIGTPVNHSENSDINFSLKVPHYQRPYKWTSAEVENLIKDWKGNLESSDRKYFAGSVVSVAVAESSFHSLIDGQQRITTLFLANFINFILLRRLILSDIDKKRCARLQKYNESLAKTIKYIFTDEATLKYFESVLNELNRIADDDVMEELHSEEDCLDKYQKLLWLPKFCTELQYKQDSVNLIREKLEVSNLYLHYDRSSFNQTLKQVLSQLLIGFGETTELNIENFCESTLTDNEKVYANSLKTILTVFENEFPREADQDIYRYIHSLHEKLSNFLQDVNLCVIQTSNTDDAYTLFEVMNDRALALDDLDLIKNQFFKKFVTVNHSLDEKNIDDIIQKLDDQWGDKIFHHKGMNTTYKKLVTYLSTVFLTGSKDLRNEASEKYRINLSEYLSKQTIYTTKDIQRDFNIFETCFEILRQTKLPVQKKENGSIIAEFKDDTNFKRCLYFLSANKQDGVISGLFNFTLSAIERLNPEFNLDKSKNLIKLLLQKDLKVEDIKSDLDITTNQSEEILMLINEIQQQSYMLWKSSLMSSSAELPREIARSIIEDNYLSSKSNKLLIVKELNSDKHKKEFQTWLNNWQYKGNSLFKVKTLFARIIGYSINDQGELITRAIKLGVTSEAIGEIELDHMVAKNTDDRSIFYFKHDEIEMFINGLGNMMPLPKDENIDKSNYPLEDSFKYYEKAGLGDHFLIKMAKDAVTEVTDKIIEPEVFFTKRKEKLIDYFNQIL